MRGGRSHCLSLSLNSSCSNSDNVTAAGKPPHMHKKSHCSLGGRHRCSAECTLIRASLAAAAAAEEPLG